MKKDFDRWNESKKATEARNRAPLYHEREVRWCRLGVNIGFEQDGTGTDFARPVLVLKGFSRHVCLVLPLTTSQKENKYHFSLGDIGGKRASVIISQLRLIDAKRLDQKIATLDTNRFAGVRRAVIAMLDGSSSVVLPSGEGQGRSHL